MLPPNAALLVIDVQQGLDDPKYGPRSTPEAEAAIARLLGAWRAAGWPVVHIQHLSTSPTSPLRPQSPGVALKPEAQPLPDEPLFQKRVHSAFVGTDLEAYLHEHAITTVVAIGLTTNHCVSTTVRMANNLGFETLVVADATAAHAARGYDGRSFTAEEVHATALASLHGEFATVVTSDEVLAALGVPMS